ncbi:putative beta-lysine N-acetyltransferase [Draconibacterium sp. IB214405]|uniref:putative beta-lysine N-acetyltransferase n=1 Tax=Draconibacterium sp. IB214405 TaxID=3097352 RepID=UPI002A0BCFA1|nr:putative beta-lysine N-acetyltransferase [Draconibacterium sp. IB214405]MDX8341053.1 putative beta-lysine N-acetyltransferase [Draconibacterium sp. IB214405]
MQDKIEKIGNGSVIHHGQLNSRVYLMKLNPSDCNTTFIHEINELARKHGYTKIFCKIPDFATPLFLADGFFPEAQIPAFYNDKYTAFFVSKFLNSDRLLEIETDRLNEFNKMLEQQESFILTQKVKVPEVQVRKLDKTDFEKITEIYRKVFVTYPFPIYNPGFVLKSMQDGTQYFGAEAEGQLIALASAEIDKEGKNAEMTDFATLPQHRGRKLALLLLDAMEISMKEQGIKTLYTIARLNSPGMNKTFLKLNYRYSGTLIKNTHIAGKIESMNVLYKHI